MRVKGYIMPRPTEFHYPTMSAKDQIFIRNETLG